MNIFSVGDGEAYELTRNEYINRTHKKFPFYQDVKKYKTPYFAICPACNNPIQIINLFGAQYEEEQTCRTTMHGRHFTRNVDGLPAYNQENYNGCPLHNPVAFRIRQIREIESVNEEIRDLVENNRDKLANDIRGITGVLLKNEKIMQLIDDYIEARDYCYTHTNKFNIPLNNYLADIDEQATEMMFRLVEQMADKEGVTEQLKVEKPMLWVGRMNEIQARAREIVYADIIYK